MSISEFGIYLKKTREDAGLTITKLAKLADISHAYISQIENGKKLNPPSVDILKRLYKPLGISFFEIMEKAGYYSPFYDVIYDEDDPEYKQMEKYSDMMRLEEERREAETELTAFLQRPGITYNSKPLTQKECIEIAAMLGWHFKDRQ